ncbi:DUF5690 family protein [Paraglaciecola hydrolytica]|uniref:MFS transporter n=1 Tax=Paraglaciecola hydrolytica TaxID=1799789 RepID=A0A148KKU1_9ALTE|nr:DUF5690 family protein [Paraglaciecola hydrolytica]KXI26926.1 hypothetical protein AX660_02130 [Paraglaciecola hydrolytica]
MKIKSYLNNAPQIWLVIYAASAAFITYFSMYAFRKPFTVGTYENVDGWHSQLDFKIALILAQVLGYALSKFIGIKIISEMEAGKRAVAILSLVMAAEIALILFPILPGYWKLLALFLNGLPLGMIWGLVFSFLEGRRTTEILGAVLSVSFIVSSGVVKSVGKYLMLDWGINEFWMPAVTGLLFAIPLFLSVYFLAQVPPPSEQDIQARRKREPMSAQDRRDLLLRFAPGLAAMICAYVLLTGLRDYSDNFAAEIWSSLGYGSAPGIFSIAAIYTSLIILFMLSLVMLVKDNLRALMLNHIIVIVGFIVVGVSSLLYQTNIISGSTWMVSLSTGVYLSYIPFNCLIFDRMLAVANNKANAGFLIYIADSMGYAGSVGILLYKNFAQVQLSWTNFLVQSSYIIAVLGVALILYSAYYFRQTLKESASNSHCSSAEKIHNSINQVDKPRSTISTTS